MKLLFQSVLICLISFGLSVNISYAARHTATCKHLGHGMYGLVVDGSVKQRSLSKGRCQRLQQVVGNCTCSVARCLLECPVTPSDWACCEGN